MKVRAYEIAGQIAHVIATDGPEIEVNVTPLDDDGKPVPGVKVHDLDVELLPDTAAPTARDLWNTLYMENGKVRATDLATFRVADKKKGR